MRTMPITPDAAAPVFTVQQRLYDVHLSSGKFSVHICSKSGRGRFYGPQQHEGTIQVFGKVVNSATCYLPRQVVQALTDGGFDCAHVEVV